MKSFFKLVALVALSSTVAGRASAILIPQTNGVQNISFQLTFITQGPFKTNSPATNDISTSKIRSTATTKDVIAWLGAAMNTNTFTNTFSSKAHLVRVHHFNATTNVNTFEIRDGTNAPVDVSAFFAGTGASNPIKSSTYHAKTGLYTGQDAELYHLDLTNVPPYNLTAHFHAVGFGSLNFVSVTAGKSVLGTDELDADNLAGSGAGTNGVVGLVSASVGVHGTVSEVK